MYVQGEFKKTAPLSFMLFPYLSAGKDDKNIWSWIVAPAPNVSSSQADKYEKKHKVEGSYFFLLTLYLM